MSMKGIYKSLGSVQTQEARRDWRFLADYVTENGYPELAKEFEPGPKFGWKRIDKQIGKLREAYAEKGYELPPCPSNTEKFHVWLEQQEN